MPRRPSSPQPASTDSAVRRAPAAPRRRVAVHAPEATRERGFVRIPYVRMPGLRAGYVHIRYVRMAS